MEYMPEVIQVIPTDEYTVYVYFDDGSIKLYDAKEIIQKGVFQPLKDIQLFKDACTVLNGTLAWDLNGTYDETSCLDIDPFTLYEDCPEVDEPEYLFMRH